MLQPKRTKYRKAFKGRIHGVAKGGSFTLMTVAAPAGAEESAATPMVPAPRTATDAC